LMSYRAPPIKKKMPQNNKTLQILIKARDLASGQFKKLEGGVQRLRGRFQRLSATAT